MGAALPGRLAAPVGLGRALVGRVGPGGRSPPMKVLARAVGAIATVGVLLLLLLLGKPVAERG